MKGYFIRLVAWMLLVIIASVFAFAAIFSALQKRYFRPDFAVQVGNLQGDLYRLLENKSPEEAKTILAERDNQLLFQTKIVTSEAEVPPDAPILLRPQKTNYFIALTPDNQKIRTFEKQQNARFIVSLFTVGIIIILAALALLTPLLRKLKAQEKTLIAIADGDLNSRAPTGGKDALGRLGLRINQMADRISELLGRQRELIHAVSHELRTPCARIGFGLDLLAEAKTDTDRTQRIESLHADLNEMDALLEELLSFLRFDDSREHFHTEPLDLNAIIPTLIKKAQPFGPEIQFKPETPTPLTITGHPQHLPRALENLLRNAARHAKSQVTITATQKDQTTTLHIDDDGPGIPELDRARIFDPFTRLDTSRTRNSGGTGLGLAITHRIITRHNGTITADKSPTNGARFTITLP